MKVIVSPGGVIVGAPGDPQVVKITPTGVPGATGPRGFGVDPVTAVCLAPLVAGMPVALDRATGKFVLALASYKPKAFVVGLASTECAAGFVGSVEPVRLTLTDWTAATGAAALAVGQLYFLAAAGGLTTTPPPAPACLTLVGTAVSITTMQIDPQPPVQL